jgi:hypothetical protein
MFSMLSWCTLQTDLMAHLIQNDVFKSDLLETEYVSALASGFLQVGDAFEKTIQLVSDLQKDERFLTDFIESDITCLSTHFSFIFSVLLSCWWMKNDALEAIASIIHVWGGKVFWAEGLRTCACVHLPILLDCIMPHVEHLDMKMSHLCKEIHQIPSKLNADCFPNNCKIYSSSCGHFPESIARCNG